MLCSEESFYEALRLTVDSCVRLFLLQSFPIFPVGYILGCPLVLFWSFFTVDSKLPSSLQRGHEGFAHRRAAHEGLGA